MTKTFKQIASLFSIAFWMTASVASADTILNFEDALQRSLAHAHDIILAQYAYDMNEADRYQVSRRPNPVFSLEFENDGGSWCGHNKPDTTVAITQDIELGGKRSARESLAQSVKCLSGWDYEIAQLDLQKNLKIAFIDVMAAQENDKIAQARESVAKEVLETVTYKVNTGKAPLLQQKKASIAYNTSKLAAARAKTALLSAKIGLSAFWDSAEPDFDAVQYPFYDLKPPSDLNQMLDQLCHAPEISKADEDISAAYRLHKLERAEAIPDLSLSVGYEKCDEGSLALGFEIAIPVFNQNRGNICKAQIAIYEAQYHKHDLTVDLKVQLVSLYKEWVSAYQAAHLLKDLVVNEAAQSFDLTGSGYKEGKFEYLELLDSQTTMFDVQQQLIEALQEYHHKHVEALRLIGGLNA
jgi:outer membrane protein, heavy metal efflux system